MKTSSSLRSSYQSQVCDALLECDYIEARTDILDTDVDTSRLIFAIEPRAYESRFARVGTRQFKSVVSREIDRAMSAGVNKVVLETLRLQSRDHDAPSVIDLVAQSLAESLSSLRGIDTSFELFLGSEPHRSDFLSLRDRLLICEQVNASIDNTCFFASPVVYLEHDAFTKRQEADVAESARLIRVTRDSGLSPFREEKMTRSLSRLHSLIDASVDECGVEPDFIVAYDEKNYRSIRSQGLKRFVRWSEESECGSLVLA